MDFKKFKATYVLVDMQNNDEVCCTDQFKEAVKAATAYAKECEDDWDPILYKWNGIRYTVVEGWTYPAPVYD